MGKKLIIIAIFMFINDIFAGLAEVQIPLTLESFKINGNLEEKFYAETPPYELKSFPQYGKLSQKTQAWITEDKENIIIAFRCFENNIKSLKKEESRKDGPVTNDDCVEVFLSPDAATQTYYHFATNILGTKYDAYNSLIESNKALWNGIWDTKASTSKDYWCVEIKIPKAQFIWGKKSTINLCRERRADKTEYGTLAPLSGSSFHSQVDFLPLKFKKTALVFIKQMPDLTFYPELKNSCNINIINEGENSRDLKTQLKLYSANTSEPYILKKDYSVKGRSETILNFDYTLGEERQYHNYEFEILINNDVFFFKKDELPHIFTLMHAGNIFYPGESVPLIISSSAPYSNKHFYRISLSDSKKDPVIADNINFAAHLEVPIVIPNTFSGRYFLIIQ